MWLSDLDGGTLVMEEELRAPATAAYPVDVIGRMWAALEGGAFAAGLGEEICPGAGLDWLV